MNRAKGQVLGRTWSLSCLKRSLPLYEDDEPVVPSKRCRLRSSSSDMEPWIWSYFPEDLFELVLARLPIRTLVRFRLVCKIWNSLLTKKSYTFSIPQSRQPWFCILNCPWDGECFVSIYDSCSNKWSNHVFPRLAAGNNNTKLVGSAGGLICFTSGDSDRLYVWNPITQAIRELPQPDRLIMSIHRYFRGMISDNNDDYILIWIDVRCCFSFYHSRNNSWTRPEIFPYVDALGDILLNWYSPMVHLDGTLYFMLNLPEGIASFDMTTRAWKKFDVPFPTKLSGRKITEYRGKIILVGLVDGLSTNARRLCLWELETTTRLLWKEIDQMPLSGVTIAFSSITCYGRKGDLIMWTLCSEEEQMHELQMHVMYNFKTRDWLRTVPSYVPPWPLYILQGTAFQPCLFALP